MPGTLFVVATPIGNLEDITVRALRVLREVAVIAAEDTRRTAHLLARHAIATPTTSLHEHNEAGKAAALVARLQRGDHVALVSDAGTPTVSDPGGHLIRQAIDAGIRIEPIPGPSAVLTALAASGLPTDSFSFLGFPPTRAKDRKLWFARAKELGGTVIFFEAPHRIRETLSELATNRRGLSGVRWPRTDQNSRTIGQRTNFERAVELEGRPWRVHGGRIYWSNDRYMMPPSAPTGADLATEIGEMTINGLLTKRKAINIVARRHGLAPNRRLQGARSGKEIW